MGTYKDQQDPLLLSDSTMSSKLQGISLRSPRIITRIVAIIGTHKVVRAAGVAGACIDGQHTSIVRCGLHAMAIGQPNRLSRLDAGVQGLEVLGSLRVELFRHGLVDAVGAGFEGMGTWLRCPLRHCGWSGLMSPSPCHQGRLSLAGWCRGRF